MTGGFGKKSKCLVDSCIERMEAVVVCFMNDATRVLCKWDRTRRWVCCHALLFKKAVMKIGLRREYSIPRSRAANSGVFPLFLWLIDKFSPQNVRWWIQVTCFMWPFFQNIQKFNLQFHIIKESLQFLQLEKQLFLNHWKKLKWLIDCLNSFQLTDNHWWLPLYFKPWWALLLN